MKSSEPLQIEIASDIVCPWCYIGKRRLEAALELFVEKHTDQPAPVLTWVAFQLNPGLPIEGMPRADYLQRKFGSPDGGGIYERVSAEGVKEGLDFRFERIARQPNTLRPHALVAAAGHSAVPGLEANMAEALMKAYFCDGADLTRKQTLVEIAVSAGMDATTAATVLEDSEALADAKQQDQELRQLGIQGVPFFIFNRNIGVSGAQTADNLLAAMEQALAA